MRFITFWASSLILPSAICERQALPVHKNKILIFSIVRISFDINCWKDNKLMLQTDEIGEVFVIIMG